MPGPPSTAAAHPCSPPGGRRTLYEEASRVFGTMMTRRSTVTRAIQGYLPTSFLRSTAWAVFLDVLPSPESGAAVDEVVAEWPTKLAENRKAYMRKLAWYTCDPRQRGEEAQHASQQNPSSSSPAAASNGERSKKQQKVRLRTAFNESDSDDSSSGEEIGGCGLSTAGASTGVQDPKKSSLHKSSVLVNDDPLSQSESSKWHRYFTLKDLSVNIELDLARMSYEDVDLSPNDIKVLANMLSVFSLDRSTNNGGGYHQGMPDVAFACLVAARQCIALAREEMGAEDAEKLTGSHSVDTPPIGQDEWVQLEKDSDGEANKLLSALYVEADAYNIFVGMMGRLGLADYYNDDQFIILKTETLMNVSMPRFRPNLAVHLTSTPELPQVIISLVLKWSRLMFVRTLQFAQVFDLWDGIFAACCAGQSFHDLLGLTIMTVLAEKEDELVCCDSTSLMMALMHEPYLPAHRDMRPILASALGHAESPALYRNAHFNAPVCISKQPMVKEQLVEREQRLGEMLNKTLEDMKPLLRLGAEQYRKNHDRGNLGHGASSTLARGGSKERGIDSDADDDDEERSEVVVLYKMEVLSKLKLIRDALLFRIEVDDCFEAAGDVGAGI